MQISSRKTVETARAIGALTFEAVALLVLFSLYRVGRVKAIGHESIAYKHAFDIWRIERDLHIPTELHLESWFLDHPLIAKFADTYYANVHFPLTSAVLIWLFFRRRSLYGQVRNTLIFMTGFGLLLAFLFPLAPPRMMTSLGFTDVATMFGQSIYGEVANSQANQFAAMPSLHVGWAVLVGYAIFEAFQKSRLRWLAWAHPLITIAVVVGTGNHFWADGIVGIALLVFGWQLSIRMIDGNFKVASARAANYRAAENIVTAP